MTIEAMKHMSDRIEALKRLSDNGQYMHIPGLSAGACWELAIELDQFITAIEQAEKQEPVAVVSGYYGGQCVVVPTNPARLFNSGTAFYTTPPAAPVQEPVTILPDGSAFGVMSFPLPQNHWLYAPNEYRDGEYEPIDLPKPILTHALRDAVVAAVRYAVRGATMRGQEMDFDPDALVQNAVYALCGPYTTPPAAPVQEPVKLRRGDVLRCIETDELCTVWATSTTGKTLVKWSANNFGDYTAEQIGELFWIEPAPVQEPDHGDELTIAYMSGVHRGKELAVQRQWVGLTDEEILELLCIHSDDPEDWEFEMKEVRAIEAKLKEKNT